MRETEQIGLSDLLTTYPSLLENLGSEGERKAEDYPGYNPRIRTQPPS